MRCCRMKITVRHPTAEAIIVKMTARMMWNPSGIPPTKMAQEK